MSSFEVYGLDKEEVVSALMFQPNGVLNSQDLRDWLKKVQQNFKVNGEFTEFAISTVEFHGQLALIVNLGQD